MRTFIFYSVIFLSLASCTSSDSSSEKIVGPDTSTYKKQEIFWHWENDFSAEEQEKMKEWITVVSDCAQKVLGKYPFDLNYHFHREDNTNHAVIFGHTARTETMQAAHFYVNPIFPMDDFMEDWIAPHEISHLALPRLGKPNKWFFEGFATYMSRKVMTEMGVVTAEEADSVSWARIAEIKSAYESNSNFVFVADSLIANYHYSELYWGGGSYFHKIDRQLQAEGKMELIDVLKYFQFWVHQPDLKFVKVIEAFDKISQSTIFSDSYTDYTTKPARGILLEY